ncbi:hypothetical protein J2X69_001120 [Algoriphagus sp. 4150]|uniref:hypothetical protein n=1 Tax=Algoriphagus sp. 4150 TaxID=2817756 RepID=UPI0028557DF0|nr:hypothetical protein [Algoriphagus sp. 4150]MDR7128788.1 hypothetical protein [Algoriphagus sp. 4150]
MKSLLKINFLMAFACLLILGSCSDNDSDPPKTNAELIGSGIAWKLSTATASGISVISLIEPCLQDNLVTFHYETGVNTGVLDSGPTKCDDSELQTVNFIWDYNESTKVLTVDIDLIEVPRTEGDMIVESVGANELVVSQNISLSGFTQKVIVTFIH